MFKIIFYSKPNKIKNIRKILKQEVFEKTNKQNIFNYKSESVLFYTFIHYSFRLDDGKVIDEFWNICFELEFIFQSPHLVVKYIMRTQWSFLVLNSVFWFYLNYQQIFYGFSQIILITTGRNVASMIRIKCHRVFLLSVNNTEIIDKTK